MPYLQLDLDAKKRVPHAARLAGISTADFGWGLMDLWEWCWGEKTDVASLPQVAAIFGADGEKVIAGLVAFRFGEKCPDGVRVKGADRYLRVTAAKARGARAANAAKAQKTRRTHAETTQTSRTADAEGAQPSALTPSTEHRAPNTEKSDPPPPLTLALEEPTADAYIRASYAQRAAPELPRWREVTKARRDLLKAAAKKRALSEWDEVFARTNRSGFLRGQKPGATWKADLDWLLKGDNATKVLEGQYDDPGIGDREKRILEPCAAPGCANTDCAEFMGEWLCYALHGPAKAAWTGAPQEVGAA